MRFFLFFLSLVSLLLALDENQSTKTIEVDVINNSKNSVPKKAKSDAIVYDYVPQELNLGENSKESLLQNQNPPQKEFIQEKNQTQKQNLQDFSVSTLQKPRTLTKVIDAKASGANEQEALNNALIMALSQLKGVSGENLKQEFKSVKFNLSTTGQIEQSSNQFLQNVSKGRIDTYKINAINKTEQGVEVEISAYKYIFENNQKAKLIIYDLSHTTLSESLKQALNDVFAQSKNFQLLQRENDYKSESDLLKSEEASSDESYKLGNVLGADYILEFKLLDAQKVSSKINSGEKLSLNIAYKLIFFPTREVFYSKTLNSKMSLSNDIKKQQKALEKIALDFNKELENQLFANESSESDTLPQSSKATTYKIGEKGGVNLGF